MPNPSLSDVIKPEVRGLSAYTLQHFDAGVKLDQNENPYELPTDLKREVAERVLRRPWARYPEFVPQPTFTLYKLMARALQAEVEEILLDAERLTFEVDKLLEASRTSEVVVVSTPNNPT